MQQRATPSLFRHGPSAEVRLFVFAVLAIVLLVLDSRMRVLEPLRQTVALGLYPFQRVVMLPGDGVRQVNDWMSAATLIRAGSSPNGSSPVGFSSTTRSSSRPSIADTSVLTAVVFASSAAGATICHASPAFRTVVVSPDVVRIVSSSIEPASISKTFSPRTTDAPAGSRFDSTK